MSNLSFSDLRKANQTRMQEWPGGENASLEFTAIELAGECGELMEAVKKYLRYLKGISGSAASIQEIIDEIGDVQIALDLFAQKVGVELGVAAATKFNKTSKKYGLKTKLEV